MNSQELCIHLRILRSARLSVGNSKSRSARFRTRPSPVGALVARVAVFIVQGANLLRNQAHEEHKNCGDKKQSTHIGKATVSKERIGVVADPGAEKRGADR